MRYFLLLFSFVCTINGFAQTKKLTIEDCVLKGKTSLAPEKLNQPIWVENKSILFYTRKIKGTDNLVKYDWKKKPTTTVWSLSKLNEAFTRKKLDTLKKIPTILKATSEYLQFINSNSLIRYDYRKDSIILDFFIDENAENIDVSKSSNNIAYVLNNNLFIKPFNGKLQTITTDGGYEMVYGKSVHRDEYGISKGTYWSPKGDLLAFYKMNQSMVTDYPILDLENKPSKEHNIKYPMAGGKSHEVSIGVYNIANQKLVYLNILGPADQYLTNIAWSNDEKHIYVVVLNRKTTHLWLNEYDASTGNYTKTILEEENNNWVEPTNPIQFLPNSNSTFVWQSQRTGHNHLYLYDVNGELIKTLTHGDWDVISVAGITSIKNKLFFTATTTSPLDQQICSVDVFGFSNSQQISHESGIHTMLLNDQSGDYLDMFGSNSIPRISSIYDRKGKLRSNILLADNPLKDYKLGSTKIFTLKADDNTLLYTRMILPNNFDSTKKYPCITYVYNGPHVQLINNAWLNGADLWLYYLAQEGFVIFTIDGRGSGNRGFDFEKIIHRQIGTAEIADQIKGNTYLRSLKFIDTARLGIHGWSYGGFMTTSLMTRTPGKYKVGVCGGPVIDWSLYEVMYTERYMDTPSENPDGFKKNNLLNYVDNLSGKLLMIHGTSDDVVVWQHSLMYLKKCVDRNKQIDYFCYPGHLHNVLGKDRIHLLTKITEYFKSNL
jgi:dipeptidyl-peptidase-4